MSLAEEAEASSAGEQLAEEYSAGKLIAPMSSGGVAADSL
jgi:hypothetical protein